MRPRTEIEKDNRDATSSGPWERLQLEILLDIRDILQRIESEQPLGAD